jgi:hypothetical protein
MPALERSRTRALVLAEGPLVEPLAAVAHGFFGPDVGCGHEPVQDMLMSKISLVIGASQVLYS